MHAIPPKRIQPSHLARATQMMCKYNHSLNLVLEAQTSSKTWVQLNNNLIHYIQEVYAWHPALPLGVPEKAAY